MIDIIFGVLESAMIILVEMDISGNERKQNKFVRKHVGKRRCKYKPNAEERRYTKCNCANATRTRNRNKKTKCTMTQKHKGVTGIKGWLLFGKC